MNSKRQLEVTNRLMLSQHSGNFTTTLYQRSKRTTAEPNSKNHDSNHLDRTYWAGGTPEGITISNTVQHNTVNN